MPRPVRLALAALLGLGLAAPALAAPFSFVALGDMPYGKPKKVYKPYARLIEQINETRPALVVHVGDTKSGSTKCSDKVLDAQRKFLNDFAAPTLYTPGDNEWTDCWRKKAGKYDPLERLAYIRKTYFKRPETSFGDKKAALEHQGAAGFPENARLLHEGVMFITAHVVGSNNNFETRDPAAAAEFFARDAAVNRWVADSFAAAAAARAEAVVLAIHADLFRPGYDARGESWPPHSGFHRFGPALQTAAATYGGPVLLVFGDSHQYKLFRPFPKSAPNVTALEVFGAKNMHAVQIQVSPGGSAPFGFRPVYNDALK